MKKNIVTNCAYLFLLFLSSILFSSCQDFVQNVDPPIDSVNDDKLDAKTELQFLITGLRVEFSDCLGELGVLSGGLSDELIFTLDIRGATYPQYDEIEHGLINLNNNSVENALLHLGNLRVVADTLVERVKRIKFNNTDADSVLLKQALFNAHFYGGMTRFLMASYFGLEPTRGGMALSGGPFIPSAAMYQLAIDKFKIAAKYAVNTDSRLNSSFLAKTYLMAGRYQEAEDEIGSSLLLSEPPFVIKYSNETTNFWYGNAGDGRMQWALNDRFSKYVSENILDTTRIKYISVQGVSGAKRYLMQYLYSKASSPIVAMSWQECYLMISELSLRLHPDAQGKQDALDNFNIVRDSRGLPNIDEINLDSIYNERDKELNCTGNRLLDQRRFNKWHLPAGTWQYLPITNGERSRNPNLK